MSQGLCCEQNQGKLSLLKGISMFIMHVVHEQNSYDCVHLRSHAIFMMPVQNQFVYDFFTVFLSQNQNIFSANTKGAYRASRGV